MAVAVLLTLTSGIGARATATGVQETADRAEIRVPPIVRVDDRSEQPDELLKRGRALADERRYTEAIQSYDRALQQKPDFGEAFAYRALAYALTNAVEQALRDLNAAEALVRGLAITHKVRAVIANRRSDQDLELAELSKLLAIDPTDLFALTFRASIYQERRNYAAAMNDAEALVRLKPDDPSGYHLRAALLGTQRSWAKAAEQAKYLERTFATRPDALAAAAQIYSDGGYRERALDAVAKALELRPDASRLWSMRAVMRAPGDFAGRQSDLEMADRLSPGDLGVATSLGLLAFDRRDWKTAERQFTRVLQAEPRDFGLLTYRALTLVGLGDRAGARRDYDAALAVASGPGDLSMICRQLAREGMELAWALDTCGRAVAAKPERGAYLANRGLARLRAGELTGAVDDFSRAIAADPTDGDALYGRAVANVRLKRPGDARRDRTAALGISPNVEAEFAFRGLADLVEAHSSPPANE